MIYSCFDQNTGLYRYFKDSQNLPVNGDLPVPNYLKSRTTKLGVPSLEAGRALPSSAQPVGTGWNARGIVVRCDASNPFGELSFEGKGNIIGGLALGVGALLFMTDQPLSGLLAGGLGLALLLSPGVMA